MYTRYSSTALTYNTCTGSTRVVKLDYNLFLDYKRTSIKPDEVLVSIFIPFTEQVINPTHI